MTEDARSGQRATAAPSSAAPEVITLPSPADVAGAAAERFVALAAAAVAARGRFTVALSGGSTPKALYARLAVPACASRIDWTRVHVFWGDERCVPPDDASSNFRMAREALLDHVPVPAAQVHRLRGEDDPTAAAAAYERELRGAFPDGAARFDLVLLGMGDNGHTASLFPRLSAVRETARWVVAERVDEVGMWRLTLTPPALNGAAAVVFLVAGRDKAAMLARVLEGPRDIDLLPVQAVAPVDGTVTWLIDAAAAAQLARGRRPSS
ncbi:MAG TPA: 6-phosphogluconolactonase [Polyangia bacterium]